MEKEIITVQKRPPEGIRIDNPFTLKVGQVFTGFGVGCGVGIGVGRPLNIGAIPVLSQVMSATRGATDVFSGIGRHANAHLRKLGVRNIEAGIGCGVGFGHGFGVGLAVKPGFINQLQSAAVQGLSKIIIRFGMAPNLPSGPPFSSRIGTTFLSPATVQNPMESATHLATEVPELSSQVASGNRILNEGSTHNSFMSERNLDHFSRTKQVMGNLLKNSVLEEENGSSNEQVKRLQSENSMLRMVLKHQQVIEELMEENKKIRRVLVEDLKVPASKLQASNHANSITAAQSPCSDCFECRRKQRKIRGL